MKGVVFFLFFLLFATPCSLAADIIDITKTPWGLSISETAQTLKLSSLPTDSKQIVLDATINGYAAGVIYLFWADKLSDINLQILAANNPHYDESIGNTLIQYLDENYGARIKDSSACPDRPDCTYMSWEKDDTTLVSLVRDNGPQKRTTVIYADKTAVAERKKTKETEKQEAEKQPLYSQALESKDAAFEKAMHARIQKEIKWLAKVAVFEMRESTDPHVVRAGLRVLEVPQTIDPLAKATKKIALLMVQEMVNLGINPGEKNILVTCWAYTPEKGVTGKSLIRQYGRAIYDPSVDSISWENAR